MKSCILHSCILMFVLTVPGCMVESTSTNVGNENSSNSDNSNTNDRDTLDMVEDSVVFPTSGDVLIVVDELKVESVGSVMYYGADDGTEVRTNRFIADTGNGTLDVVFDSQDRVATMKIADVTFEFHYNDDDTFDVTVFEGVVAAFTTESIEIELNTAPKLVTQRITILTLEQCASSLVSTIALESSQDNDSATELFTCLLQKFPAAFAEAQYSCLVERVLEQRLEMVFDTCSQALDPELCIRRVTPWLERLATLKNSINLSLKRQIEKLSLVLDRDNECPDFGISAEALEERQTDDDDFDGIPNRSDVCPNTDVVVDSITGEREDPDVNAFGCTNVDLNDLKCLTEDEQLLCELNGCCRLDCLDPVDPDCSRAHLCRFRGRCCLNDNLCEADCPEPDTDCDLCGEDGTCIEGCTTEDPDCTDVGTDNGNDNGNETCNSTFVLQRVFSGRLANITCPSIDVFLEARDSEKTTVAFPATVSIVARDCPATTNCTGLAVDVPGPLAGTAFTINEGDIDSNSDLILAGIASCNTNNSDADGIWRHWYDATLTDSCGNTLGTVTFTTTCCSPGPGCGPACP